MKRRRNRVAIGTEYGRDGLARSLQPVAILLAVAACVGGGASLAEELTSGEPMTAPTLAAASQMGRGLRDERLDEAASIGVTDFRDALYWNQIEREPGRFAFNGLRRTWPDRLAERGASASLTVNWGNDLYDGGDTPYTDEGRQSFARFAAEAVQRFPNITTVEVGNEFNGVNYVRGPVREADALERAAMYAELLAETSRAVKAVRPDVEILGGATHSLPVAYLARTLDGAGEGAADALAVHPYTTEPEQLVRQVAVLRGVEAAASLPLEITEFGEKDPATADDYLVKMMCTMGLSGVSRAAWYPLMDRGDGHVPLLDEKGVPTSAGRAFAHAREALAGRKVRDVSPDPFTYACLFDERTLVVWGEPREVTLAEGFTARDAQGRELSGQLSLSMEEPLVISGAGPVELGRDVELGKSGIVADSFHQFAYPGMSGGDADGFERFARRQGKRVDLVTRPGQERGGAPWVPYLAAEGIGPARLQAGGMLPSGSGRDPVEIVHRYVAPGAMEVELEARVAPADRSTDGVTATVTHNGEALAEEVVSEPTTLERSVSLEKGDEMEIAIGPNGEANGDITRYRFTLRERAD